MEILIEIQNELKVPKSNWNDFSKFKYRSCEDILEAVKPLLAKYKLLLIITDTVESIGNKLFIKSTATIGNISVCGYAEISEHKGMSSEQTTGTASSYARKYALNGLFLIDEAGSDPDSQKNESKGKQEATKSGAVTTADKLPDLPWLNPKTPEWDKALLAIKSGKTLEDAKKVFRISKTNQELLISEATK